MSRSARRSSVAQADAEMCELHVSAGPGGHSGRVQWHWGNIGSAAAGLAALIATVAAVYGVIRYGPAWLRDSRERQQAQAAAAREQEALAREQQEQLRLDRHRHLYGWSRHGVNTYGVVLVTAAEEMDRARDELTGGGPSAYLVLRVSEGPGDVNRALSLRQLAETEGALSRPPTAGELEALEAGLAALGFR